MSSTKDLLEFYRRRAMGDDAVPPPSARPHLTIVHAHAEATKSSEKLRRLAEQEPSDGGRKA